MKHHRSVHRSAALRPSLSALLTLCCAAPALAQQSSLVERVQLDGRTSYSMQVTQSQGEPLATAGPQSAQDILAGRDSTTARETMLWAVHPSGFGVGIGVEQRGPYNPSAWQAGQTTGQAGLLVGLSLATSESSQLVVQTPLLNSPPAGAGPLLNDWQAQQEQQRRLRFGLVFNTSNRYSDLRRGLRMELSNQTTLALNPRGGHIGFTLQKNW